MADKQYFNLHGSAAEWVISQFLTESNFNLVICENERRAEELYTNIKFYFGSNQVFLLRDWEHLPLEPISPLPHVSASRIEVLQKITSGDAGIVVAPIDAISRKYIHPKIIHQYCFTLQTGLEEERSNLLQKLIACGFRKVSLVEDIGEFAVRGDVIDIYGEQPYRIEFFGDEVETIKIFNTTSQRSTEKTLKNIQILPVQEFFPKELTNPKTLQAFRKRVRKRSEEIGYPGREFIYLFEKLEQQLLLPGMEMLHGFAPESLIAITDILPANTSLSIENPDICFSALETIWKTLRERETIVAENGILTPHAEDLYLTPDQVNSLLKVIPTTELHTDISPIQNKNFSSHQQMREDITSRRGSSDPFSPLIENIEKYRSEEYRVAVVCGSTARENRIREILLQAGYDLRGEQLPPALFSERKSSYPLISLRGTLTTGVTIHDQKISFISEADIFGDISVSRQQKTSRTLRKLMSGLQGLENKDFIVHQDYGVGQYLGLKAIRVADNPGDFLEIQYADSKLFLPIQQIAKIQRFVSAEDQPPVLNRLGSNRWQKTKERVRKSITTLAGDLIRLYATRELAKRPAFPAINNDEQIFHDLFPFEETPDQQRAIEEVLADMQSEKPMDRLICGDAGFGKTEVAIRASFKCLQAGKQVIVLAPTTILVDQHFRSFQNRFEGYPVQIQAVSRFFPSKENRKTLESAAEGKCDILIGTHRLLQRDVEFADPGLLIIDEEHRFGVKQKERIKSLKRNIDVLTLTATPIPRTLHMSLMDLRDISIISTPPQNRRTIRSYIAQREDALIRDAIMREHRRGGQAFYVHNRVQTIATITEGLRELVPEVHFEYAHGQMKERELEEIMHRYLQGDIDVLVSTTIIESGIDIPNANTLIIERADCFGLAQLYQLRGRVGRSNREAFAYLLLPTNKKVTGEASERLNALKSIDDPGVGFHLAMRDLEIRGAGNLLGKEQHGNVMAVGVDLYHRIIREAIAQLKGEDLKIEEQVEPEVKTHEPAYIPEDYIPDIAERLILYQRLSSLRSEEESWEIREEIRDRFGRLRPEIDNLIELMTVRSLCRRYGIETLEIRGEEELTLSFHAKAPINSEALLHLVKSEPETFRVSKNHAMTIKRDPTKLSLSKLYNTITDVLDRILSLP